MLMGKKDSIIATRLVAYNKDKKVSDHSQPEGSPTIEALLHWGPQVNTSENFGWTALHWASQSITSQPLKCS